MRPGDVVICAFPGAHLTKTRPAVVLSSESYHDSRGDVILSVVTSKIPAVPTASDYLLSDWADAGLRTPSVFRLFLVTLPVSEARGIGRLSSSDWAGVRACCKSGLSEAVAG
ncbi:hypothetical protein F183_A30320 [Bryobacterales bacterium F-183]|nr:hypothetical protein F183_A30320 [Bryobacterales bacterium F-183]